VPPGDEPDVGPVADPVGTDEIVRVDADTIAFGAPADETFRLILDAVHDVGAVTYLDRSVPIVEVLCRFVGEPATSLVITLQGRMDRTEAFCTAESIENRPGPPASAVVDLLEDAVRLRAGGQASGPKWRSASKSMIRMGSTGMPLMRVSRCRCGPVERPVLPT